jgi:hypothetical protein
VAIQRGRRLAAASGTSPPTSHTLSHFSSLVPQVLGLRPEARRGATLVLAGSVLLLFGGQTRHGSLLNDVWALTMTGAGALHLPLASLISRFVSNPSSLLSLSVLT